MNMLSTAGEGLAAKREQELAMEEESGWGVGLVGM